MRPGACQAKFACARHGAGGVDRRGQGKRPYERKEHRGVSRAKAFQISGGSRGASPLALRKGCAFPTVCRLNNLLRAAGRLSLPAARGWKKKGGLGQKGRALPQSGAAEPPRQSGATASLDRRGARAAPRYQRTFSTLLNCNTGTERRNHAILLPSPQSTVGPGQQERSAQKGADCRRG